MPEQNLEQVKKLAEQLSPEDRIHLFRHMADLPDSGMHSSSLSEPPYEIQEDAEQQETLETTDNFVLIFSPPGVSPIGVAVILKGKTVFQVFYYPENFMEGRLKMRSWQDAPPSEIVKERIRLTLAKHGIERTEEEIIEAGKEATRKVYEAVTFRITNEIAARLPDMTGLLVDATIKIIEISIENSFVEQTGQLEKKKTLEDMEKILEPYWRHIKDKQLGVRQGGARPRKSKFIWDAEKALKFYQTVEALPCYGADKTPMWLYARNLLRDNDYDYGTVQFLKSRSMFADVSEDLLKEAANVWRQYDERWDSLPAENSPTAFAFRYACCKLNYPEYAYNTLRAKFYQGQKEANKS